MIWSKVKVQKDKQRSTKHTHKTKDRVTPTPLKTGYVFPAPLAMFHSSYRSWHLYLFRPDIFLTNSK